MEGNQCKSAILLRCAQSPPFKTHPWRSAKEQEGLQGDRQISDSNLPFPDNRTLFYDFPHVIDAEMIGQVAVIGNVQDKQVRLFSGLEAADLLFFPDRPGPRATSRWPPSGKGL